MTRTIENCSRIAALEKKGKEQPTRFWLLNRCWGISKDNGETCEACSKCKYYVGREKK